MTQLTSSPLAGLHFRVMNGLGNDFVVLDGRLQPIRVTPDEARAIGDRDTGIGFDQLIVLEPSQFADVFMRILNADGSDAGACGNATRCIARLIMDETGKDDAVIETVSGFLAARDAGAWDQVTVDMGEPKLRWHQIPLSEAVEDTSAVPFDAKLFAPFLPPTFSAVNMGNPHAVFFVDWIERHDLRRIGRIIEQHRLFPHRVNVSLAKIMSPTSIKLEVWERGAGMTRACGTAACAALVAAVRAGFTNRKAAVTLPGGTLMIHWRPDGHVLMTGAIELEYEGELSPAIFAAGEHTA